MVLECYGMVWCDMLWPLRPVVHGGGHHLRLLGVTLGVADGGVAAHTCGRGGGGGGGGGGGAGGGGARGGGLHKIMCFYYLIFLFSFICSFKENVSMRFLGF